jgi:hypothetical protein
MGEQSMNYGQPVYGTGMEQYETVLPQQQQRLFHEMLPPQQHYHPLPPPVSSGSHHLPPPMMVSMQYAICLTFGNVSGDTYFQNHRI